MKLLSYFDNVSNESGTNNVLHREWFEAFIGFGGELEHVAFLVLCLSRYVFPSNCYGYINLNVFSIAMRLARGTRIALAPAVLASIYRDLGLLKAKIVEFGSGGVDGSKLTILTPFVVVQMWVWERFTLLGTKPVLGICGKPRLARWVNNRKAKVPLLRSEFASSGECFIWRPYALLSFDSEVYCDDERILLINPETSEELMSFGRCLRGCELVGVDCIEQYLPHRVGMQFGFDQDIPCFVSRCNQSIEVAWGSYSETFHGTSLYLPPRLYTSDVTVGYFNWWGAESDRCKTRKRSRRRSKRIAGKRSWNLSFNQGGDDIGVSTANLPSSSNVVLASENVPSQIMNVVSPLSSQCLAKSDHVTPSHGIETESTPRSPSKFRAKSPGAIDQNSSRAEEIPHLSDNQADICGDAEPHNPNKANLDVPLNVDVVVLAEVCSEVTPSRADFSVNVDEMDVDTDPFLVKSVHENTDDETKSGPPGFKSTPDVNISVASTSIHHVDIMNVEHGPSCDKNPPHCVDNFDGIGINLPCDKTRLASSNFTECENAQTQIIDEVSPLLSLCDVVHVDPAHNTVIESTFDHVDPAHDMVGVNDSVTVPLPNSLRTEDIPPLRSEKAAVCEDVSLLEVSPNVGCVRVTDCNEASPSSATDFSDKMRIDATPSLYKRVLDCENLSQNIHKNAHDKTNTDLPRFQFRPEIFVGSQTDPLINGSQNNPLIIIDEDVDTEESDDVKAIKRTMSMFDDRISKLEATISDMQLSHMV